MRALLPPPSHPLAIAMWDFSWLERRWPGGGYESWTEALSGLRERGYDVVRIDAYPHLSSLGGTFELVPVWSQHDWGSPEPVVVEPVPNLLTFLAAARDQGLMVSLSTWFRADRTDARRRITSPAVLAEVWNRTLRLVERAGLLESIWFVDLGNEWPQPMWAPFLYTADAPDELDRRSDVCRAWTNGALERVADEFPDLPLCFSFIDQLDTWPSQDVSHFGLLEIHSWMTSGTGPSFYDRLGYDIGAASFDPEQYAVLRRAHDLYRSDERLWQAQLVQEIVRAAAWSTAAGLPLVTTECWAVVCWKDADGLDWGWIKELCAFGVETALATGRWAALSTSNFCGPQFHGMWDDPAWHTALTDRIHATPHRLTPATHVDADTQPRGALL